MPAIGPTFDSELTAAGVTDRRFAWGADGSIEFHPDMPQVERDKVNAALAAHNAATPDPRQVDRDAQAALAADCKADAIFDALKSATPQQISTFVNARFDTFPAPQRQVMKLILQCCALFLRRL